MFSRIPAAEVCDATKMIVVLPLAKKIIYNPQH